MIYETGGLGWAEKLGYPVLSDFGETRYGRTSYTGLIQPDPCRAPEVILDMPWSCDVDIWNVGVMVRQRQKPQMILRGISTDMM